MSRKALVILILVAACGAPVVRAEDAPYAEYRYLAELGQIQIVTALMGRTPDLEARLPALEKKGIVVLESDKVRTFSRMEHVGAHRIETRITIQPPVGHGEGGASSNVDLLMAVDGKTRVDCPLSSAALGLDRIVYEPGTGFITLNGHQGILRFDGFEARGVVDADWLEKRAKELSQILKGMPQ
jgi:hypothetical protein